MGFELEELLIEEKTIGERIIEEIAKKTGKNIQEIFSIISERQEKMANLLSFEVVALIVAKEAGLDISEYLKEVKKRIFDENSG
ncbi:MAG: hypothetical protein DSO01_03150 [Archaeoglobi archaeon]|jgi:hypothetical protein|nr:DUF2240 family protein [Archaeoglobus sp.]NHW88876.1 DUF2240 family protein [Archaeoglobales archaeon]TDA27351.1 MAG: hypothetical protein DSO01_03150 [Archaeoglobi archaeon]